jgi:hypothetical protein
MISDGVAVCMVPSGSLTLAQPAGGARGSAEAGASLDGARVLPVGGRLAAGGGWVRVKRGAAGAPVPVRCSATADRLDVGRLARV